jgi:hypothetical protein
MAAYAKIAMRLLILTTLVLAIVILSNPTTVVWADAHCCVTNCDPAYNQCVDACHQLPRNQEIGCLDVCVQNLNDCHDSCGGC